MRVGAHRGDLVGLLVLQPRVDEVLREDVALGEELVILAQRVESSLKRAGQLRDVLVLGRGQLVEVLVDGGCRLDAALDAVDARHEACREGEVGVRARVRHAVLDALGLRGRARHGDADACGAVARRVHEVDRGFETGNETSEGVHRRVREGEERGRVLEQAANEPAGRVGQGAVAALVVEQGLAVLPQRDVRVHARTVVAEQGLGHEGRGMTKLEGRVLDDVLELHHVVGRGLQRREAVVDLLLATRADLVVGALDRQADLFEEAAHLVAHVRVLVGGGDGEVAALDGHLVAHVAALFGAAGVPVRLGGVNGEEGVVRGDLVAHVVEEVELRLGADEALVRDAGRTQVGLGLGSDLARVA